MTPDREIPPRHELKYLVPEERVAEVRALVRPFCEPDRHSAASGTGRYLIRSLYLDTPSRTLYRLSRSGAPGRFKVRVRGYEGDASPLFLEVKRKGHAGLVLKTRARLASAEGRTLLEAIRTGAAGTLFADLVDRWGLAPVQLVHYEREAWASVVDEYARVTFDRRILSQRMDAWDLAGERDAGVALDDPATLGGTGRGLVLELKCTREVPAWMHHAVQRLGLRRTGFSKYCNGLERLGDPAARAA